MKTTQAVRALGTLLSLSLVGVACSDGNGPSNNGGGGGGGTDLVVSNAAPGSGNGTLSGYTITVDSNSAVAQGPAVWVVLSGNIGSVGHEISIYILKADGSFPNIEHYWGTGTTVEGHTICDAAGGSFLTCDAAHVSASLANKTITFTGLVLGDATGDGDASTLSGTAGY